MLAFLLATLVHLGPETPVGSRTIGTAAFEQRSPSAAWNGQTGFAAWIDGSGTDPVVRISPMRADGSLVDPYGTPVVHALDARIVANGSSFELAYIDFKGTHVITLDEHGAPSAPAPATSFQISQFTGIPFGNSYAFLLVLSGGLYLGITAPDDSTTYQLLTTDRAQAFSLTTKNGQLLIAYSTGNEIRVLTPGGTSRTVAKDSNVMQLSPAFEDVIAWADSNGSIYAIRDGDAAATEIAKGTDLTFTRTSDGVVAFWTVHDDIVQRVLPSTADFFSQPKNATPAVLSVNPQSEVSVAANGVKVWREGNYDTHIMLSAGDRTIGAASSIDRDLRDPSVASGANILLVTWRDLPRSVERFTTGYRIFARRFTLDGTPLDVAPIPISSNDSQIVDVELGTATAFDGRNFVVIWSAPYVRAARLTAGGTLIDTTPFDFDYTLQLWFNSGFRTLMRGDQLLVAWSSWDDFRNINGGLRIGSELSSADVAMLDTRGATMHITNMRRLWREHGFAKHIGLAANGDDAIVTSAHLQCIEATLLDASLATVRDNASIARNTDRPDFPSVAWNGSEFVVAWAADTVHAMRFDRALQPLDDAPFNVAPAGAGAHEPVVTASPSGVEITYERLDGDVPRLFTRELDRAGIVPRTRSIR